MRASKSIVAISSALALGYAIFFEAAPALAYVACNHDGDCWQTGTKVHYDGVLLSFHDDSWWDARKNAPQYHWHDADAKHRWQHGYWRNGQWYGGL